MSRHLYPLAVLGLPCLLLLSACQTSPRCTCAPLLVASDIDNAPFAELDASGKPRGRDVEMMELIAAELGRPLAWKRMEFADLLPAVERGEVDVVCATLGITPERAERVRFSLPYYETVIAAVVRSGQGEPRALADLAGKRVAAGAGTTSERALRLRLPLALAVLENKDELSASERLARREIDAGLMDGPAARALVAGSNGALALLTEDLGPERYALALPHDRAELCREIDRCLRRMRASGALRALDLEHGLAAASFISTER